MESTKKLKDCKNAARNDLSSGHEQKERYPARLSGTLLEYQHDPPNIERAKSDPEIFDYVDNPPSKSAKASAKIHGYKKGIDETPECEDNESLNAGHGAFIDLNLSRGSEEAELKELLQAAGGLSVDQPQGVESEPPCNVSQAAARNLPVYPTNGSTPLYHGNVTKSRMAAPSKNVSEDQPWYNGSGVSAIGCSLPRGKRPGMGLEESSEAAPTDTEYVFTIGHSPEIDTKKDFGMVSLWHTNVETKEQVTSKEPHIGGIINHSSSQISTLGESSRLREPEITSHIHDEAEIPTEGRIWDLTQQSCTTTATQSTDDWIKDSHVVADAHKRPSNQISFKLPALKIPGIESFGFSFSPRFEETLSPVEAMKPRPVLNPFEDIERQGRCSLLNHPRSPEGSRHHSRRSTLGLQAFGPLPSVMKTSKETGDQPPILPSPPCITCNVGARSSIEHTEAMKVTSMAEPHPCPGGGSCYEERREGEGKVGLGLEPANMTLNIDDFDILFSPKQKPCERSPAESGLGMPSDTNPTSQECLCHANSTDFATLGAESVWMSSRTDHGKMVTEVQGKGITGSTCAMDDGTKNSPKATELDRMERCQDLNPK